MRSTFVTVVAWIFIALSGFSTLVSALQNVMIRLLFVDQFSAIANDPAAGQIPAPARFMFAHLQLIVLVAFLVSVLMLVASIGLLQRRNWARLMFMGLMVLGVIYLLGGLAVQESFISSFATSLETAASRDSGFRARADQFRGFFIAMRVFMLVFAVGLAGLYTWIVVKLSSEKIRSEFAQGA